MKPLCCTITPPIQVPVAWTPADGLVARSETQRSKHCRMNASSRKRVLYPCAIGDLANCLLRLPAALVRSGPAAAGEATINNNQTIIKLIYFQSIIESIHFLDARTDSSPRAIVWRHKTDGRRSVSAVMVAALETPAIFY